MKSPTPIQIVNEFNKALTLMIKKGYLQENNQCFKDSEEVTKLLKKGKSRISELQNLKEALK